MEITYIGHSCFKIKGKTSSIVIDPYDAKIGYKLPKLEADIVLNSHDHFDHGNHSAVSGSKMVINTPGEYELSDVFIYGIPTFHDNKKGEERGPNIMFLVEIDGFNILHVGDLGHELTETMMEKITKVDVLMIPVGGKYTIDAKAAAEVVSSLEPGLIIPMHYKTEDLTGVEGLDGIEKFLAEMGVDAKTVRTEEKLKITSHSDIPDESQVVVLKANH